MNIGKLIFLLLPVIPLGAQEFRPVVAKVRQTDTVESNSRTTTYTQSGIWLRAGDGSIYAETIKTSSVSNGQSTVTRLSRSRDSRVYGIDHKAKKYAVIQGNWRPEWDGNLGRNPNEGKTRVVAGITCVERPITAVANGIVCISPEMRLELLREYDYVIRNSSGEQRGRLRRELSDITFASPDPVYFQLPAGYTPDDQCRTCKR